MTLLGFAAAALLATVSYSTSKAVTVCTGTVALRDGPVMNLQGGPLSDNAIPANRDVNVSLPQPFSSSMYCTVTGLQKKQRSKARSPGADYYRVIACGEKASKFMVTATTDTSPSGWETASLGLMDPKTNGSGAIALITIMCGTDLGTP